MNRLGATVIISAVLHLLILRGGSVPNSVTPKISVERGKTSVSLRVKQSRSKPETTDKPTEETREKERNETSKEPRKKRREPESKQSEAETSSDTTPETTKQNQKQGKSEGEKDDSGEENPVSPSPGQVGARMVRHAEYRRNPSPQYPTVSRRRGEEGTVILKVQVDPKGNPTSVDVAESSGHDRLDRAAVETVRDWSFTPAEAGGQARGSTVRVPIRFQID